MKKKILFIEDDAQIRMVVTMRLVAVGFEVLVAKDGQEGLELARKESPDIILLDLMLPKMDGYKLCRMIKYDGALEKIPVIVCSARGGEEDKKLAMQAGANAYIVKPFDVKVFVQTVQKLAADTSAGPRMGF